MGYTSNYYTTQNLWQGPYYAVCRENAGNYADVLSMHGDCYYRLSAYISKSLTNVNKPYIDT